MSHIEELIELETDVKDAEMELKHDEESLELAKKYVWKSKVNLADAIIKLNEAKKLV